MIFLMRSQNSSRFTMNQLFIVVIEYKLQLKQQQKAPKKRPLTLGFQFNYNIAFN